MPIIDYTVDPRLAVKGQLTYHVREVFLTALIDKYPDLFGDAVPTNFHVTRGYLPQKGALTHLAGRINRSLVYLERDEASTNTVGLIRETIAHMGGKLLGSIIRGQRMAAAEFEYKGWYLAVWVTVVPTDRELPARVRVAVLSDRSF